MEELSFLIKLMEAVKPSSSDSSLLDVDWEKLAEVISDSEKKQESGFKILASHGWHIAFNILEMDVLKANVRARKNDERGVNKIMSTYFKKK